MRRIYKHLAWPAGTVLLLLLAAFLLAQVAGVLAVATYLLSVLFPGVLVFTSLLSRFPSRRPTMADALFQGNVIGLSLAIGMGWLLARSGVFSLSGTLVLEWVLALLFVAFCRGTLARLWHSLETVMARDAKTDGLFIAVVAAAATLLMFPILLLLHQGFLNADDTATFARIANSLAHTGGWGTAVRVFPSSPPGFYNTTLFDPGVSVFYALFVEGSGVNAVYVAQVAYLVPMILAPLGLFLVVRRFTCQWAVVYVLPFVWMMGSWWGGSLFFNNQIAAAYFGVFPDAALSVVGYLAVLLVLVGRFEDGTVQWRESLLLSFAILLCALSDPLALIFGIAALLFLGWRVILTPGRQMFRGSSRTQEDAQGRVKSATESNHTQQFGIAGRIAGLSGPLQRLIVIVLPTVLLLPPYLVPRSIAANSPALSSGSGASGGGLGLVSVRPADIISTFFPLGLIGFALCGVALWVAVWRLFKREVRPAHREEARVLVLLGSLTVVTTYAAFSGVASEVVGVATPRLVEYSVLSSVPLVGFALGWVLSRSSKLKTLSRPVGVIALTGVLVLSAASAGYGLLYNDSGVTSLPVVTTDYSPAMLQASSWLADNEIPGRTIVVDENLNNNAPSAFADFCPDAVLGRPGWGLYQDIESSVFPPQQDPYFVVNQAIEFPNSSNEQAAFDTFKITYYVFQIGVSDSEISLFSQLSYFKLIYANAQIDIFQYIPGESLGFIAATSYVNASSELQPQYVWNAYSTAFGLPPVANAVSSAIPGGSALDGSTLTYRLALPVNGTYTLHVHRVTDQTSEYLRVSISGIWVGTAYYSTTGPDYGSAISFTSSSGVATLTLTLEGTVGYVDAIDFLVLNA
ncbi:MAG: hypothetical protein KGJ23_11705 [Euryarchaeota archaeon]|nr:hypothetical protein [Euryarchaeota archaeon]MDE1837260.1 hypothetical protein [Euryarchaeota archaeon]MDE1879930.1 hypothetical protein [Euryarchaeota archaeon]MDE2045136.1 hypothetical protein [Thermoplasmata archaeon]